MADPRNELADIVVPLAPEVVAKGSGLPLWALAAGLAAIVCVGLATWSWHRRRPARELRHIVAAVNQQQGTLPVLARRLDAWARARFRLPRLEGARCPAGIEPAAWSTWVDALAQLRFASPQPDGFEALAALCQTARRWESHA
jgi:hypothetical protein